MPTLILISLTVYTILIVGASVLLQVRTRAVHFAAGTAFLYYWSLYGGWAIIADRTGGASGRHYQYLEKKLFSIELDGDYLWALSLYALFILAAQATALCKARGHRFNPTFRRLRLNVSASVVVIVLCISGSLIIVAPALQVANTLNMSTYYVSRFSDNPYFTIHQVLSRMGLLAAMFGFVVALTGTQGRWVVLHTGRGALAPYGLALFALYALTVTLGNKNELVFSAVFGMLFYCWNARRINRAGLAAVIVVAIGGVGLVDATRGTSPTLLAERMLSFDTGLLEAALSVPAESNEAFGAHFSLYGVLSQDVPIVPGYSVLSLATAMVPRLLWRERPFANIYTYYAQHIGAVGDQGYSLHHATGWYLNFGSIGVILGGVLVGWLWAWVHNASGSVRTVSSRIYRRTFVAVGPSLFVATLPALVRTGIEGYKGLMVDVGLGTLLLGLILRNSDSIADRWCGESVRLETLEQAGQNCGCTTASHE